MDSDEFCIQIVRFSYISFLVINWLHYKENSKKKKEQTKGLGEGDFAFWRKERIQTSFKKKNRYLSVLK